MKPVTISFLFAVVPHLLMYQLQIYPSESFTAAFNSDSKSRSTLIPKSSIVYFSSYYTITYSEYTRTSLHSKEQSEEQNVIDDKDEKESPSASCMNMPTHSRRNMLQNTFSLVAASHAIIQPTNAFSIPEQKSYSSNAKNLDRLSVGDSSGGSVYENNPKSSSAARRRAMLGCKTDVSRNQAMAMEGLESLNQKDCNLRVIDGDTEFMLKALRSLECPTCPYGIKGA